MSMPAPPPTIPAPPPKVISADTVYAALGDPTRRRLLYHLSPSIPLKKTDSGWEMDFGYCLVRG